MPASPISVEFIRSLRDINALIFGGAASEAEVFEAVSQTLTRLGLYGAVLLPDHANPSKLTIVAAVTQPIVKEVERLTGLSTVGHTIDPTRVAVFRELLIRGQPAFVEDTRNVLSDVVPAIARPFLHLLWHGLQKCPALYVPLHEFETTVGILSVTGDQLTRGNITALSALGDGVSLALDRIHGGRRTAVPRASVSRDSFLLRLSAGLDADAPSLLGELVAAFEQHALVTITDELGRITYVDDGFCALMGFERAELLGQTHRLVTSRVHGPEHFRDLWRLPRGESGAVKCAT